MENSICAFNRSLHVTSRFGRPILNVVLVLLYSPHLSYYYYYDYIVQIGFEKHIIALARGSGEIVPLPGPMRGHGGDSVIV